MNQFLPRKDSMPSGTKRGIVVLLILVVIVLFIRYHPSRQSQEPIDFSEFDKQVEQFYEAIAEEKQEQISKPFYFNPNQASVDTLIKVGLSRKIAHTIENYRKAGGCFYHPSDMKKIYGITEDVYSELEPFIVIDVKKPTKAKTKVITESYSNVKKIREYDKKEKVKNPTELIDINKADSILLITIYGVGPVFAHRIMNYRELLGGFVNKSQLIEVFGMRPENFKQIEPSIMISTDSITKINLNSASFKQLLKHPYITYNQTKSLVRYRDIMLQFDSVGAIIANHLMDSVSYYKVQPYLVAN